MEMVKFGDVRSAMSEEQKYVKFRTCHES